MENFQSHARTKLEFQEGLNVIIGPSDQGKSAIIRALRWICYNEPKGTDFFRIGSNSCRVKVKLDSGEEIVRERTSSKNRYIYRNQEGEETVYEGFGNSIPLEITQTLKMPKIELDTDSEVALNISQQLEGPFLLNEKGALRAKMIGRLTGVHIIDVAIRDTAKDLLNFQQEEKRMTAHLKEIEGRIEEYNYLPGLYSSIQEEEEILQRLVFLYNRLGTLKELKKKWDFNAQEEKICKEVLTTLSPIDEGERIISQAKNLIERHSLLNRINLQWQNNQEELRKTQLILNQTKNLTICHNLLQELEQGYRRKQDLTSLKDKINKWKGEYRQVKTFWDSLGGIGQGEEKLKDVEVKLVKLTQLKDLKNSLVSLEKDLQKQVREHQDLEDKLRETILEYQTKLKESNICPLCFSPLNDDALKRVIDNYQ